MRHIPEILKFCFDLKEMCVWLEANKSCGNMNMTKTVSFDHLDKKASDCALIFEGEIGKSLQLG